MDLSSLTSLRLYVDTYYGNNTRDARADKKLLAKLHHLTSLEEFHLNQVYSGRSDVSDSNRLILASMTNVLKQLAMAKDWPRLRRLELRYLATTVADFQTFVAPHAGTIQTFQWYGGLLCEPATWEERVERFYLPRWIRTVICPKAGEAKFEHLLEPWEKGFYDQGLENDTHEKEDTEDEGNEEVDTEDDSDEEEDTEEEGNEEKVTEEEGNEQAGTEKGTREENTEEDWKRERRRRVLSRRVVREIELRESELRKRELRKRELREIELRERELRKRERRREQGE